jgi:hypothetical protein
VTSLLLLLGSGLCAALLATPRLAASEPLPLGSVMEVRFEMVLTARPAIEVNDLLGDAHRSLPHSPRNRGFDVGNGFVDLYL